MLIPKENQKLNHLIEKYSLGSQNAFAELIGVTQTNINRLFRADDRNGEVPNVLRSKSVLTAIKNKFPFADIEWFKKEESDIIKSEPDPEFFENKNGNKFIELKNGKFKIIVRKVPVRAFGSYLSDFQNVEFLEELEEVSFTVDHIGKGKYMCFEVEGDSMNGGGIDDTPDGAELLCRELGRHHWKDGFNHSKYGWVIVHKKTVLFKDIKSMDKETGDVICGSRSGLPNHPDFTINLNDVNQILKVIKRTF
ncbi:hypothetical protein ACM55H_05430 [Flavobacterium sp. ZT3R17]|uniref:hypothetical protein n=1 Tax=Flavobacterium cryoconiti TaxID=3398736 RepID=UPI003A8BE983